MRYEHQWQLLRTQRQWDGLFNKRAGTLRADAVGFGIDADDRGSDAISVEAQSYSQMDEFVPFATSANQLNGLRTLIAGQV
jgi:hypothetical protein